MDGYNNTSQGRRRRPRRGHRLHLTWLLVAPAALALLLLAGCGLSTGAVPGAATSTPSVTPTAVPPRGTLQGKVEASPTCPVEPAAHPCSPAPVPHRPITVETPNGTVVETITTDVNGRFSTSLPVGSYVLRVAIEPGTVGIRQVTPGNVSIVAGQTTTITIELDTGIR